MGQPQEKSYRGQIRRTRGGTWLRKQCPTYIRTPCPVGVGMLTHVLHVSVVNNKPNLLGIITRGPCSPSL